MTVDPESDITIACGATEATASVFLALFNPGDEVLIFEPFYENYGPDAILCEAKPVYVPLTPPGWAYDEDVAAEGDRAEDPRARAEFAAQSRRGTCSRARSSNPSRSSASSTT